jgi:F420-dependent oxidoreductase-like protein
MIANVAKECDELGFDSFWVMDHLVQISGVGGREEPILEGWTTLAALAPITRKIRLGTLCTCNTFRHPAHLAKIAATVDNLSDGRLIMGMGAGWFEDENRQYGIPFHTTAERLARLEETVKILKLMWREPKASFSGRYYSISDAICEPKPIQKPGPLMLIGGGGEKKTLRYVAEYGDACNLHGDLATIERKLTILKQHCKTVGRPYEQILKSRQGPIVVAKTRKDAERMLEKYRPPTQTPEAYRTNVVHGNPEEVAAHLQKFVDLGIEYLTGFMPGAYYERTLKLFAEKVLPQLSR